jgi:hypothetical protein
LEAYQDIVDDIYDSSHALQAPPPQTLADAIHARVAFGDTLGLLNSWLSVRWGNIKPSHCKTVARPSLDGRRALERAGCENNARKEVDGARAGRTAGFHLIC